MSHFLKVSAAFKDADALCVALEAMGFAKAQIERYATAQTIRSIYGTSAEAEIIVRKPVEGGSRQEGSLYYGDMGFKFNPMSDEYECVMEDYDRRHCGFNTDWFGRLKQEYAVALTTREYQSQGFSVDRTNLQDGKVQLAVAGF